MNNWEIAKIAMTEGIKITCWENHEKYIYYTEGVWHDEDSAPCNPNFINKLKWKIYQEKPKKVKNTYYRAWYVSGNYLRETVYFDSMNELERHLTNHGWKQIEIETKEAIKLAELDKE